MATNVKKIQTLEVNLQTRPGALSKVYGAFKEAGVNVIASWAWEQGDGTAHAVIYPTDLTKAKTTLTQLGMKPTTCNACYVESEDKVGCYADVLQKVANAGVNLSATDAYGVGGKFATVLFTEEKDYPALCKALGC